MTIAFENSFQDLNKEIQGRFKASSRLETIENSNTGWQEEKKSIIKGSLNRQKKQLYEMHPAHL